MLSVLLFFVAGAAHGMYIPECEDVRYVFKSSTLVVRGRVEAVEVRKDKGGTPHTLVRVKVLKRLKGKSGPTVVIKRFGGMIDGVGVADEGPTFEVGQTGYLYLENPKTAFYEKGRLYGPVCGWGVSEQRP